MIQAQATMRRIGLELIDEKRQIAAGQMASTQEDKHEQDAFTARLWRDVSVDVTEPNGKMERESLRASAPPNQSHGSEVSDSKRLEGRDLLSVLSECSIHIHTSPLNNIIMTAQSNPTCRLYLPNE